jgi:drug/metabolite transporter (DMT)-like permease
MEILLGIAAAVGWGVADFCARFCSLRIGAYRTLMYMQPFGALALSIYLWRAGDCHALGAHGWQPWAFAAVAGVMNALSSLGLYYAFEVGTMSVAGPVSSAYPAVTVTLALLSGERLDATRWAGLVVIFAGIILAALSLGGRTKRLEDGVPTRRVVRGAEWAMLSAVGYGIMFWWLGFHVVRELGGPASVWMIRVSTFVFLLILSVPAGRSVAIPRGRALWLLLALGLIDTAAFVANNAGLSMGHVSVVTVLSSMYGAVTVLLAAIFVRERLALSQWLGIGLIFAGIVLVNL